MSEAFRSLDEALRWLGEATDYERGQRALYRPAPPDLSRMRALLDRLGRPETRFRSIHVAGTKGKGSTTAMIAAILSAHGRRTGATISPHLERITERIVLAGREIGEAEFAGRLGEVRAAAEGLTPEARPTFFEIVTAAAFLHFARGGAGWAVAETGLGGRFDATNVLVPAACVIASISFDHVERLGATLARIAAEKAGILKPGVPAFANASGSARDAVAAAAARAGAPVAFLGRDFRVASLRADEAWVSFRVEGLEPDPGEIRLPTPAPFQAPNAALALAAAAAGLRAEGATLDPAAARGALARLRVPGRLEIRKGRPRWILDGAHNAASAAALAEALGPLLGGRPATLLVSISEGKDAPGILDALAPLVDRAVATCADPVRSMPAERLAEAAFRIARVPAEAIPDPGEAMARAGEWAGPDGTVLATGSMFLAGRARGALPVEGPGAAG